MARETFPLLLMWLFIIIVFSYVKNNKKNIQKFSLIFIVIIFTLSMEKYYLYKKESPNINRMKIKFIKLAESYDKKLEISLPFPYGRRLHTIDRIFRDRALFFEDKWIIASKNNILLPYT